MKHLLVTTGSVALLACHACGVGVPGLPVATFVGGAGEDRVVAAAVDRHGRVYVAGSTCSVDFPDHADRGPEAVGVERGFVSMFDGALTTLTASIVLGGGAGVSRATALALDADAVYVVGYTDAADFPVTPGAYGGPPRGARDLFVVKLSADLSAVLASARFGGGKHDEARGVALGGDGHVYVAGWSGSHDYPVTAQAYDGTWNGGRGDVVVSVLDKDLSQLHRSTFIGGTGAAWANDVAGDIALDGAGNVYVAGYTDSADYPVTPGAYHNRKIRVGGGVLVSKLDKDLGRLLASTVVGAYGGESRAFALALGGGGVYVTGVTRAFNFPRIMSSRVFEPRGEVDAHVFVAKFNADLTTLARCAWLGAAGGADDVIGGRAVAMDAAGSVYVTGGAGPSFRSAGGLDPSYNGGDSDVFVARLDGDLNPMGATFLGGVGTEGGRALALAGRAGLYVAGTTTSPDYPATSGSWRTTAKAAEGFIVRLDRDMQVVKIEDLMNARDKVEPAAYRWPDTVLVADFDTEHSLDTSRAGGNDWDPGTCDYRREGAHGWYELKGRGDDYIFIPDHESLHTPRMTISLWCNLRPASPRGSGKQPPFLIQKDRKHPRDWRIVCRSSQGKGKRGKWYLRFECVVTVSGAAAEEASVGAVEVTPNTWHHVAVTYDGKVLRLYLDGVVTHTLEKSGALQTTANPIRIGTRAFGARPEFRIKGALDAIRLYKVGLSPEEVERLHKAGRHMTSPDAIGVKPENGFRLESSRSRFDV